MNFGIDIRAAKWYRGTGIGTYTYQLVNSLNNIDIENNYNLFSNDELLDISLKNNFKIKNINKGLSSNNFWENVKSPISIDKDTLDLYHIPQNGIGLSTDIHTPIVITLHDTIPLHMPETVSEKYLTLFNGSMKKIIENCHGIITVSQFSKEDIANDFNFPQNKIYVTPLASESIYKPLDKSLCLDILKKYYSLPKNYILYVGGFSPRKNISGLIQAFSKIKSRLPKDMKLIIAGTKGISFNIYRELTNSLNMNEHILFPGFIDMCFMPHLYNGAQVLVYPSFYEGFGLPPIEAMACGTPVVASNLTSIPEILGDSALLCDPNDIEKLGEDILKVLSDNNLRESLIKKGFEKSSSLSWEATAKKTLNAYTSIINTL